MRVIGAALLALLTGWAIALPARAADLPLHGPLRILIVSDEVNPHGLSDAELFESLKTTANDGGSRGRGNFQQGSMEEGLAAGEHETDRRSQTGADLRHWMALSAAFTNSVRNVNWLFKRAN